MKKIAFAHSVDPSRLRPEITQLRASLEQLGLVSELTNWRDPTINWRAYDAVFIRPCSEYFLHQSAFYQWLALLDGLAVPAINTTQTVRWNMNKRYLQALQRQGISIIPSCFVAQGTLCNLPALLDEQDWREAIIKPSISAGAHETFRLNRSDAAHYQTRADQILASCDLIIQPFMSEIITDGEWSLLFVRDQLCHAVIKRAKTGDYRIQDVHGGTYERITPPASLVDLGRRALACSPDAPLYGRVDGLFHNGEFLVMEIELIEPFLYTTVNEALINQLTKEMAAYVT